ncbi:uncharacterized protein LOC128671714 [Plodia interpunctella]|uniref:uncharacterized protein LOC128671714 n=1 Tax=Plodia interpunctella TaxID=58824 RepID=UPI0023684BC5|nr:uncharacterized protein LOC128671714 [Plodia interpunctella]
MLRKSFAVDHVYLSLLPSDRKRCKWIAILVILQCLFVFAGSLSIIYCYWSPQRAYLEADKLARIMYLFDYESCGYALEKARTISNLWLPNNPPGYTNIMPIAQKLAEVTVSTRLSAKTRKYIELSLGVHVVWMATAILLRLITRASIKVKLLKCMLLIFLIVNIFVVLFDISMAIVYVAHIQQSLSKGMILRYSGWSVDFEVSNPDEFAGWLPLAACLLWLRGGVFLFWNIFCCKLVYLMRSKIKRQEVRRKLRQKANLPIPEPDPIKEKDGTTLYYRTGEYNPEGRASGQLYSILNRSL